MTAVLVLHALGDPDGGAPWSEALVGADLAVTAPDLPGHGQAGPSADGSYATGLILLTAARWLAEEDPSPAPVVVGAGASGWVALILALAGRAGAVAVIDGLGGPWRNADEATADGVAWARQLMEEPVLSEPVAAGVADPRLGHLLPPFSNQRVARQALAALSVPLLVVSSPDDPLAPDERADLLAGARSQVTTEITISPRPSDVAPALSEWIARVAPRDGDVLRSGGQAPG